MICSEHAGHYYHHTVARVSQGHCTSSILGIIHPPVVNIILKERKKCKRTNYRASLLMYERLFGTRVSASSCFISAKPRVVYNHTTLCSTRDPDGYGTIVELNAENYSEVK